jgi:cytidine deaminase
MKAVRGLPLPTSVELIAAARKAQSMAHAPYSNYFVGAAILSTNGTIYVGANIENQSYGATICAERTAIAAMVMGGDHEIEMVAVVTPDDCYPCGICLQSLSEFINSPETCKIVVPFGDGIIVRTFSELAPHLWSSKLVKKKP